MLLITEQIELAINFKSLSFALTDGCWERRYYLDVLNGDVVQVAERTRRQLQDVYDAHGEYDAQPHLVDPELQLAHAVEMDDERYIKVIELGSAESTQDRDEFAETVEAPFQRLLWNALDNEDYAAFDRLLNMEPADAARWQSFQQERTQTRLTNWLQTKAIKPNWQ